MNTLFNTDIKIRNSEVFQQVQHLEQAISRAIVSLRIEKSELEEMENSLSAFLEAYLSEVGCLFEEMKEITAQINYYSEKIKNLKSGIDDSHNLSREVIAVKKIKKSIEAALSNSTFSENSFKEKELKNIYRQLAKKLQPEVIKGTRAAVEIFQVINNLYNNRNLEGLITLHRQFFSENKTFSDIYEQLDFLEKEHEALLEEIDSVRIKRHKLVISPAFELQKKFRMAEQAGQNLVSEVMREVVEKIKQRRKELLQKITYYKFLTAGNFADKTAMATKIISGN